MRAGAARHRTRARARRKGANVITGRNLPCTLLAVALALCGYGIVDEARDGDLWLGLALYTPLILALTALCVYVLRK